MTGHSDQDPAAWLKIAGGDLASAQTLLQADLPPWTAAFHAQQCVEKCLKAILVSRRLRFPKSHDIRSLILLLPHDVGLVIDRKIAAELTEGSVAQRYPGAEGPDAASALALVEEAERVLAWTRSYLEPGRRS